MQEHNAVIFRVEVAFILKYEAVDSFDTLHPPTRLHGVLSQTTVLVISL
jgi:hypothetical protein